MIIIWGQQDYADRLFKYQQKLYKEAQIKKLPFPLPADNPIRYDFDYSLYDSELANLKQDDTLIVAFGNQYIQTAIQYLKKIQIKNITIYDAALDNELKKKYFKERFKECHKDFSLVDVPKSIIVYMAKSVFDKPLKNSQEQISKYVTPYVTPIQVGAALTDKKISDITDDMGDNISSRNHRYSEATALYWMWKNADADYIGLCHYRRHWKNLDIIAENLQNDLTDVVLPVPTLCVKSVLEDYMKRYIPKVYPIMLDVLREKSPEYYKESEKIFNGDIFYACNMLIAKKKVLNSLSEWMFPIVFEIEKRVGDLPDAYENRYAGFCTERLITLYFLYNKQNFKISHADKIFIE